jgi:RHS repeat-associated protein
VHDGAIASGAVWLSVTSSEGAALWRVPLSLLDDPTQWDSLGHLIPTDVHPLSESTTRIDVREVGGRLCVARIGVSSATQLECFGSDGSPSSHVLLDFGAWSATDVALGAVGDMLIAGATESRLYRDLFFGGSPSVWSVSAASDVAHAVWVGESLLFYSKSTGFRSLHGDREFSIERVRESIVAVSGPGGTWAYLPGPDGTPGAVGRVGANGRVDRDTIVTLHPSLDGRVGAWMSGDQLLGRADWDAYGTPTFTTPFGTSTELPGPPAPRLLLTGQPWLSGLGLHALGARFYAPEWGRFLSPDPLGDADGLSRYTYVGGRPLRFGDPRDSRSPRAWASGRPFGRPRPNPGPRTSAPAPGSST